MLVSLFLLIVFTLGAASAADDNGTTQISEADAVEVDENDDLKIVNENQELADEERLFCECGSSTIDVEVREDDLVLECCNCGAKVTITAETIRNSDFSRIEQLILKRKD